MCGSGIARVIRLDPGGKYQRLLSKESGSLGIKGGHVILKPGENVGEHTTGEREEAVIVLEGRGAATINKNSTLELERNTFLYIPPKTIHDIKNTGSTLLEYIFITSLAHSP